MSCWLKPNHSPREVKYAWFSCCFKVLLYYYSLFLSFLLTGASDFPSAIFKEGLEFCEAELFRTECPDNNVVVMTKAKYGRMQFGRCVQVDYNSVGCKENVLDHLDSLCSGRRRCELRIPDKNLDETKPCPSDLKTYLNVSYSCLEVESAACSGCMQGGEEYAHVTSMHGYLGSIVSAETRHSRNCGSAKCPWKIEVPTGQTINITLFDFAMEQIHADKGSIHLVDDCYRYAVIKENAVSRGTAVCGGKKRKEFIYHSISNELEIQFVSPEVFSKFGQFVLKYEAVGCADPDPKVNTKFRRIKDHLEISCLDGKQHLVKCSNNVWVGGIIACEVPVVDPFANSYVGPLSVAIVIGIALIIAVLIVTIGVVLLKKKNNNFGPDAGHYIHPGQCYELQGQYERSRFFDDIDLFSGIRKDGQHKIIYGCITDAELGRQNFYDVPRIVENRPLPSIPNAEGSSIVKKSLEARVESENKSQKYQSVISSTSKMLSNPTPCSVPIIRTNKKEATSQHYTVLEPSDAFGQKSQNVQNRDLASAFCGPGTAGNEPCLTTYCYASSSQAGSEDGASSAESSDLVTGARQSGGEGRSQDDLTNSKIPLRPMREGSQTAIVASKVQPACMNIGEPSSDHRMPKSIGNNSWP